MSIQALIGIVTSALALKTDLAGLKTKVDKLDVNRLKSASVYLSKLSDVVYNDVAKKTVYDKLVTKVNVIDIKIPSTSILVTKAQ